MPGTINYIVGDQLELFDASKDAAEVPDEREEEAHSEDRPKKVSRQKKEKIIDGRRPARSRS